MAGPIVVAVKGDTRDLARSLGDGESRLSRFGRSAGKVGRLVGLGIAAGGVAVAAGIAKWGIDSVKSLARIERINAQTAAAIKSTGGAAGVTSKHIQNLTGRLENMTATEAESIQEGANLLLTFTNIQNKAGRGNAIFDRATSTITDMSRALGQDTKSSALQLGKALNDPIKGVSALQRVGVSFTASQKDQIGTLVKSGKTMDAQKLILKELGKEFGGAGKAFAQTTEGKIELAKHAFGTLGETIFAKLLPPLGTAAKATADFLNGLASGSGKLNGVTSKIRGGLTTAFAAIQPAASAFTRTLTTSILPAALRLGSYLGRTFGPIFKDLGGILVNQVLPTVVRFGTFLYGTLYPAVVKIATSVGSSLKPIFDQIATTVRTQVVPAVSSLMRNLEAARPTIQRVILVVAKLAGGTLKVGATILAKVLPPLIRLTGFLVGGLIRGLGVGIRGAARITSAIIGFGRGLVNVARNVTSFVGKVISGIGSIPGRAQRALSGAARTLLSKGRDLVQGVITGVGDKFSALAGKVNDIPTKAKNALGNLGGILKQKGRDLIQGLIDGIGEKIAAAVDKVRAGLQKIKDMLPGSPIKTGPLKSWNNGGAGKRLMGLLVDGLSDTRPIERAMLRVADVVAQGEPTARPNLRLLPGGGLGGPGGGGVVINVELHAAVGSTGADVGRELVEFLEDYFNAGGRIQWPA